MDQAFKQAKIDYWMSYCDLSKEAAALLYEQYLTIENAKRSMSSSEVAEWAQKIKGVIRHNGVLYWAAECDVLVASFTFRKSFTVPAEGLTLVKEFETYYDYQYSNAPTPSLGDAIKQVPKELLGKIAAIEIVIDYKEGVIENKLLEKHVLETRLYAGMLPKEIAEAAVYCKGKKFKPKNMSV